MQIGSFREFKYFTTLRADESEIVMSDATDFEMVETPAGTLELRFTLVTGTGLSAKRYILDILDPAFFAYFSMPQDGSAATLADAPAGCELSVNGPAPIDLSKPKSIPRLFWDALNNGDYRAANRLRANALSIMRAGAGQSLHAKCLFEHGAK